MNKNIDLQLLEPKSQRMEIIFNDDNGQKRYMKGAVRKNVVEFIKKASEEFDLYVFSAGQINYIEKVLSILDIRSKLDLSNVRIFYQGVFLLG
jgi:hypothetical protein